jgi:hypothetical protein
MGLADPGTAILHVLYLCQYPGRYTSPALVHPHPARFKAPRLSADDTPDLLN